MCVWTVRRCWYRIIRLTWISNLLSCPIQLTQRNVAPGTMLPLVLRIPHETVSDGDYVPFLNCVGQQGCIVNFSLNVDAS